MNLKIVAMELFLNMLAKKMTAQTEALLKEKNEVIRLLKEKIAWLEKNS